MILTSYYVDVECSVEAVSGYVRVTCDSNNPLVSPQLCTLECIEVQNFNCMFLVGLYLAFCTIFVICIQSA